MSELIAPDISQPPMDRWARIVDVVARGGSRRERGATIAAYVRRNGGTAHLRRVHIYYSESYGFQSATYARYERQA